MARPRYERDDDTALDKLAEAFWNCLREDSYHKISVASLVRRAGVNRNTFYYHYEGIDDMARSLVRQQALDPSLPEIFLSQFEGDDELLPFDLVKQEKYRVRFERIFLIAGDNSSPELQKILKDAVLDLWCSALGIKLEELDLVAHLQIEFMLGGIFALMSYAGAHANEIDADELASDECLKVLARQNFKRLFELSERVGQNRA